MTDASLTYNERRAIGEASEDAFFAFADRVNNGAIITPEWLHRIERPTELEDADGTDAIVYTDRGRIPLQIKSSPRFIDKFRKNHPGFPGFILIVHPDAHEVVFGLEFLRKLKEHYYSKKRHNF